MRSHRTACRLVLVTALAILAGCDRPKPAVTSFEVETVQLNAGGETQAVHCASVKPEFFGAVPTRPLVGRVFDAHEYSSKEKPVTVLSHHLWMQKFGGNPASIGTNLRLNGSEYTIIGIMPAKFAIPGDADLFIPEGQAMWQTQTKPPA